MKRVHLLRLPARAEGLSTACGDKTDYLALFDRSGHHQEILDSDARLIDCSRCLGALGIAPAGPRFVDANGSEVEP